MNSILGFDLPEKQRMIKFIYLSNLFEDLHYKAFAGFKISLSQTNSSIIEIANNLELDIQNYPALHSNDPCDHKKWVSLCRKIRQVSMKKFKQLKAGDS
jgi:hypothetical protein